MERLLQDVPTQKPGLQGEDFKASKFALAELYALEAKLSLAESNMCVCVEHSDGDDLHDGSYRGKANTIT